MVITIYTLQGEKGEILNDVLYLADISLVGDFPYLCYFYVVLIEHP